MGIRPRKHPCNVPRANRYENRYAHNCSVSHTRYSIDNIYEKITKEEKKIFIEKVNSPADIRKLNNEQLNDLAGDEEKNRSEILLLIEEMASKPKYDTSNRNKTKLTDDVIKNIRKLIDLIPYALTTYDLHIH